MEWFPVGCRRGGSGDVRLVFRKKFREILAFLKKIFYNRRQSIQQMSNQPTFLRAAAGLHKSRCIPVSGNSSRRNESWKEKYPQRP